METISPLPGFERALKQYYALHAIVLARLDGPLSPAARRMERAHLAYLEQAICDAEARIAQLDSRPLGASSA